MDIILESICTSLDGLELTFCTVPGLHKEINLILFFKIFMVLVQATCDCWSARLLCSSQDSSKSLDRVNIMSFWKIMSSSHLHLDKKVRNKVWQAMWEPEATTALAMLHWAKLAKSCLTWKKRLGIREEGVSIPVSTRSKGYQLGMSSTPHRSQRDLMLFVVLWGFFPVKTVFSGKPPVWIMTICHLYFKRNFCLYCLMLSLWYISQEQYILHQCMFSELGWFMICEIIWFSLFV